MKIIPVSNQEQAREFILLPVRLYKNVEPWIRPLDKDVEDIFNPRTNKTFRKGSCQRWLLIDDQNKTIGRVASFINERTANTDKDLPTGGLGFFECIEDQAAAFMLFDQCRNWLEEQGMKAMDGPINFGERDKWWGLLVDGYEKEPNYCCNYHFPYYRDFFEAYGFQIYFKQYTYHRKVADPFHPRLIEKANRIAQDPNYHFEHFKKSEMEKYTEDFRSVYNQAWAKHDGVAGITEAQAKALMRQIKPIMDEKIIWYGYYKEEPVAFFLNLPEVNQIFKYVNGKLDFWGKLKFVWHQWRKTNKKMFGVVFGVTPKHQGKGVEGALVLATAQVVQGSYPRYPDLEMNWIGDFNPKMMRVVEQVGADIYKTHHTYRKIFDSTIPFKRSPIIG